MTESNSRNRYALRVIAVMAIGVPAVWLTAFPPLDGVVGMAFRLFSSHDTVYSKNYSDSAFGRVRVGTTKEEVRKQLGEPYEIRTDGYGTRGVAGVTCWSYSHSPGDTNYCIRLVCFDSNGVVAWKHAEFWLD